MIEIWDEASVKNNPEFYLGNSIFHKYFSDLRDYKYTQIVMVFYGDDLFKAVKCAKPNSLIVFNEVDKGRGKSKLALELNKRIQSHYKNYSKDNMKFIKRFK